MPILSDGWYSIRCIFDEPLNKAVDLGKLKIGDKVITSGAILKECDEGRNILDMPDNVRLSLHANSTRKTLWDMKLGLYVKQMTPLPLSLDSVKVGGGLIGSLALYVVHQYPMLYLENTDSSKSKILLKLLKLYS